ncbi:MAG: peptide chain release factor N(5)-glutamine methyltransferase [Lachnospiraceae bacterium]
MTYLNEYREGVKYLREAGITDAEWDARYLLEYICHTDRNTLYLHPEQQVSEQEHADYRRALRLRHERIPLQHITGEQEFMGLSFRVNEHVLIPRQDTETLVEEVMRYLHDGMEILDMCTGSGCILLSLLHYSNGCAGTGVDLSEEALQVARENGERLHLDARWIQSDLFTKVDGKFDMIVSNPPYIQTDVIATLEPEVRDHEPMMALDGCADGLEFYRRIARDAGRHLKRGGMLFFEIGYDERDDVMRIMTESGYTDVTGVQDLAGHDRVVIGTHVK